MTTERRHAASHPNIHTTDVCAAVEEGLLNLTVII